LSFSWRGARVEGRQSDHAGDASRLPFKAGVKDQFHSRRLPFKATSIQGDFHSRRLPFKSSRPPLKAGCTEVQGAGKLINAQEPTARKFHVQKSNVWIQALAMARAGGLEIIMRAAAGEDCLRCVAQAGLLLATKVPVHGKTRARKRGAAPTMRAPEADLQCLCRQGPFGGGCCPIVSSSLL
jgi:hypothetical protein